MSKIIWIPSIIIFSTLTLLGTSCSLFNSAEGEVIISGSSTVEPISVRVAELLEDTSSKIAVTIDGPGTGDGFKLFCENKTDISNASRQIKESEAETCRGNGVNWIELQVAIDGMAIITSQDNDEIDCLSFEQLYALTGPESRGFTNWSDSNSLLEELGAAALPDIGLKITGPGEESGTFDSYVELVLEDIADERGEEATTRADYQASGDDTVIIREIQNNRTSLGWIGFSYAQNATGIKLLDISSGGECVSPTPETIATGTYPISRPLFIYVNTDEALENPAINEYIDFYVSDMGLKTAVADTGYVELDTDTKNAIRQAWKNR